MRVGSCQTARQGPFPTDQCLGLFPDFQRPYPDRMESKARRPPGNVRQAGPSTHPSRGSGAGFDPPALRHAPISNKL